MSTFEQVKKIVEQFAIPSAAMTDDAKFIDDLGLDSLEVVFLIEEFEAEFGIEISDDESEKCLTIGDAVKLIDGLLAE